MARVQQWDRGQHSSLARVSSMASTHQPSSSSARPGSRSPIRQQWDQDHPKLGHLRKSSPRSTFKPWPELIDFNNGPRSPTKVINSPPSSSHLVCTEVILLPRPSQPWPEASSIGPELGHLQKGPRSSSKPARGHPNTHDRGTLKPRSRPSSAAEPRHRGHRQQGYQKWVRTLPRVPEVGQDSPKGTRSGLGLSQQCQKWVRTLPRVPEVGQDSPKGTRSGLGLSQQCQKWVWTLPTVPEVDQDSPSSVRSGFGLSQQCQKWVRTLPRVQEVEQNSYRRDLDYSKRHVAAPERPKNSINKGECSTQRPAQIHTKLLYSTAFYSFFSKQYLFSSFRSIPDSLFQSLSLL